MTDHRVEQAFEGEVGAVIQNGSWWGGGKWVLGFESRSDIMFLGGVLGFGVRGVSVSVRHHLFHGDDTGGLLALQVPSS